MQKFSIWIGCAGKFLTFETFLRLFSEKCKGNDAYNVLDKSRFFSHHPCLLCVEVDVLLLSNGLSCGNYDIEYRHGDMAKNLSFSWSCVTTTRHSAEHIRRPPSRGCRVHGRLLHADFVSAQGWGSLLVVRFRMRLSLSRCKLDIKYVLRSECTKRNHMCHCWFLVCMFNICK